MQTEDNNAESLDETSALIHSSDVEMTVKEVEDHTVNVCEKPTTALLDECVVAETPNKHLGGQQEQNKSDCEDTAKSTYFSSQNNQSPQFFGSLVQGGSLVNKDTQECSSVPEFSHQVVQTTGAYGTPGSQQKNERGRGRGRRRSRWKLKFHHQALPPEYLDHYEATMAQQEAVAAAKATSNKTDSRSKSSGLASNKPALAPRAPFNEKSTGKQIVSPTQCFIKIESDHSRFDSAPSPLIGNPSTVDQLHILPMQTLSISGSNEIINRLQGDINISKKDDVSVTNEKPAMISGKINRSNDKLIQSKGLLSSLLANTTTLSEMGSRCTTEVDRKRRSSVIMSSTSSGNVNTASTNRACTPSASIGNNGSSSCSKIMNYQDLPYMGEITLDNMKPRRGRKPKKADICHLIYKNYGTIFPGTPNRNAHVEAEEWPRRKIQETSQHLSSLTSVNNCNTKVKSENIPVSTLKCKSFESLKPSGHINHSDVQNRIISSLLEKRLTAASQDAKRNIFNNIEFPPISSFNRNDNTNTVNSGHDAWSSNSKRLTTSTVVNDEPLNLCVKDLNQLKIRLLRKHGNFYEPRQNNVASVKSEPLSPSEIEELDINEPSVDNLPKYLEDPDTIDIGSRNQTPLSLHQNESNPESFPFSSNDCPSTVSTPLLSADPGNPTGSPLPGGYIYWPSAGVFVHPMALQSQLLYYQKMGAIPLVPISPADQSQAFLPPPIPQVNLIPHLNPTSVPQISQTSVSKIIHTKEQKPASNKSQIPKAFSMMMDASTKPSAMPSELTFPRMKRLAPLGNPPAIGTPTKRKRSAIFIPPMPSENSSNPTTEVSICKFKFTGGAKPSLQEKKMLSVDSGGNFRYYSGTGDKSMRGYEFFPRETLQQTTGLSGGSSSEQFLAATASGSGEKIIGNPNLAFVSEDHKTGHLKELSSLAETITKLGPECSQTSVENLSRITDSRSQLYEQQHLGGCVRKKTDFLSKGGPSCSGDSTRFRHTESEDDPNSHSPFRLRRKRKTRKSLAREKLEQTFKEKGFLIQTQQLESAEGATYCKFRQLRKFTRYLFRSWKDYLPGNVREMSVAAGVAGSDASPPSEDVPVDSEVEGELSSSDSPTPSVHQQTVEDPQQLPNT